MKHAGQEGDVRYSFYKYGRKGKQKIKFIWTLGDQFGCYFHENLNTSKQPARKRDKYEK